MGGVFGEVWLGDVIVGGGWFVVFVWVFVEDVFCVVYVEVDCLVGVGGVLVVFGGVVGVGLVWVFVGVGGGWCGVVFVVLICVGGFVLDDLLEGDGVIGKDDGDVVCGGRGGWVFGLVVDVDGCLDVV